MTHKKDGLASKVLKFKPKYFKHDNNGNYFPFCNYGFHRGLILNEDVCKIRKCEYYTKIYVRYGKDDKK